MWVQVRGLPNHWMAREVGWKIGKLFPHCLNVIIPKNGSKNGLLMKLLVEVDLEKPLLRGPKLKFDNKSE